jgi:hypothetical protein
MSDDNSRNIGAALCEALGLKNCVSLKIEIDSETRIPLATAVLYLGHDQFHPLNKVLRQYRLEILQETPLPTPDVEVYVDGRVHTFRLPEHSPECDPT